jgi:hypothetical protein
VPSGARKVFGRAAVARSLDTPDETEAKRLEKALEVEFKARLRARARPAA